MPLKRKGTRNKPQGILQKRQTRNRCEGRLAKGDVSAIFCAVGRGRKGKGAVHLNRPRKLFSCLVTRRRTVSYDTMAKEFS